MAAAAKLNQTTSEGGGGERKCENGDSLSPGQSVSRERDHPYVTSAMTEEGGGGWLKGSTVRLSECDIER